MLRILENPERTGTKQKPPIIECELYHSVLSAVVNTVFASPYASHGMQ